MLGSFNSKMHWYFGQPLCHIIIDRSWCCKFVVLFQESLKEKSYFQLVIYNFKLFVIVLIAKREEASTLAIIIHVYFFLIFLLVWMFSLKL
jgi:hypothetical protein